MDFAKYHTDIDKQLSVLMTYLVTYQVRRLLSTSLSKFKQLEGLTGGFTTLRNLTLISLSLLFNFINLNFIMTFPQIKKLSELFFVARITRFSIDVKQLKQLNSFSYVIVVCLRKQGRASRIRECLTEGSYNQHQKGHMT